MAVSAGTARTGSAPARRVAMPSWRDPRLLVGVLLVLASVVAGARVVAAADRTVPVYAAAEALTPGEQVGPAQLDVVRLRLDGGAGAGAYVSADAPPGNDLVALRGVGEGELVPAVALGPAGSLDVRPVGVPVTGALPSELVPGALVDVWVTAVDLSTPGALLEPRRVVDAAPVAEVDADSGGLGSAATTTVQVLVGTEALPDVLAALAADARVQLVLTPGGGPQEGAGGAADDAAAGSADAAGAQPGAATGGPVDGRPGAPTAGPTRGTAGAVPEQAPEQAPDQTSDQTGARTPAPATGPTTTSPSEAAPDARGEEAPAPSGRATTAPTVGGGTAAAGGGGG